jgi:ribose transport system substrate-binding protein
MKKLLVVFVILMLVVGVTLGAAGAKEKDGGEFVVGLSWNEKMHAMIQAWEDYMKTYSAEWGAENGVTFKWIVNVADSDSSQQASNIEDLISQNVDVIVARPHDAGAIGASIRAAEEAGIPFITFDRPSSTRKPTAHVGADSFMQAVNTAEAMANLLVADGVKGVAIELMGDLRDVNAVKRSDGWKDVEAKRGVWKTVLQVPTEWNPEKFRSGTANALQAHPEANVLFVASDFAFDAVKSALEDAGRWAPYGDPRHVYIATQDVNPQALEPMAKGYIDVGETYDCYYHAVQLVEVIGKIAKGQKLDKDEYLVSGRMATPANVMTMEYMWARDYED